MKQYSIGLDFDGVIADNIKIKRAYAKEIYNVNLEPNECRRAIAITRGLTNEDYNHILNVIYETEMALGVEEIPFALETIRKLSKQGHMFKVITSRLNQGTKFAEEWLNKREVYIPVVGTNQKPKTEYCKNLDIFIDDDYPKLEELVGVVPHLFLLDKPYNNDIRIMNSIKRLRDWNIFYDTIFYWSRTRK